MIAVNSIRGDLDVKGGVRPLWNPSAFTIVRLSILTVVYLLRM